MVGASFSGRSVLGKLKSFLNIAAWLVTEDFFLSL